MDKNTWYLDHRSDDLRGWPVLDANGSLIGEVGELLVDTDSGYVTTVVMVGGRKLNAHDVQIGEGVLTTLATAGPPKPAAHAAAPPRPQPKPQVQAQPQQQPQPRAQAEAEAQARAPARAQAQAQAQAPARAQAQAQAQPAKRISDDVIVQVLDEQLEIGKRAFDAGGVHLETHTVSEPIEADVIVHEERVSVTRNKVDRILTDDEARKLFHDETYEVTATSEVPMVQKLAHVVEEIVLKKQAFTHDETVHDTLRHVETDVVDLGEAGLKGARR